MSDAADTTYRHPIELFDHSVAGLLPSHFIEQYPNLILFLTKYYEQADNPSPDDANIKHIFNITDIATIEPQFLEFLEQQFLLGRTNFAEFADKRAALRVNSSLYRSKGSKFSLEQFFRMFFGIDADVVYTKNNVFIVGDSAIGPDSLRYITDDKLYQTFALLIKTSLSFDKWKESYKLFVHPAGMYVGAQLNIITSAPFDTRSLMPDVIPAVVANVVLGETSPLLGAQSYPSDVTGILPLGNTSYRIGLVNTTQLYAGNIIVDVDGQYDDISQIMTATSPTMDMGDSGQPDDATIDMSNTVETMDQDHYLFYDSV